MILDIRAESSRALGSRIRAAMAATSRPIPWWHVALRVVVEVCR
jgi:hypothetical protein